MVTKNIKPQINRIQESRCSTCPVITINKTKHLQFLANKCFKVQMSNIKLFPRNFLVKLLQEEFLIILIFQCKAIQTWCNRWDRDQMLFHLQALCLVQYKNFKDNLAFPPLYKVHLFNKAYLQEGCLFILINNSRLINCNSNKDIHLLTDSLQSF